MRVSAIDLYNIRRAQLDAERKAIEAQSAQNKLNKILLELELKYHLLSTDATLDIHTGLIKGDTTVPEEAASELGRDEDAGAQGPS